MVECFYAYPVFVGTKWQDNATYSAMAGEIQIFLSDLFQSPYNQLLQQYRFLTGVFTAANFEGAPSSSALTDARSHSDAGI